MWYLQMCVCNALDLCSRCYMCSLLVLFLSKVNVLNKICCDLNWMFVRGYEVAKVLRIISTWICVCVCFSIVNACVCVQTELDCSSLCIFACPIFLRHRFPFHFLLLFCHYCCHSSVAHTQFIVMFVIEIVTFFPSIFIWLR